MGIYQGGNLMLPNRMQLSKQTEEHLKRLKAYTGVTPNIAARLAFFRSVESGYRAPIDELNIKLDGNLVLDKQTWLGETMQITEITLNMLYPELDSKKKILVWAYHVQDGIASIRNLKSIYQLCNSL